MTSYKRKPDFENFLTMLRREKPYRAVLFELFMNKPLYLKALEGTDFEPLQNGGALADMHTVVNAFCALGYDYATVNGADFHFPTGEKSRKSTITLNEGFLITDWKSFADYAWPDAANCDFSRLEQIKQYMPEGMKLMCMGPGGVLENVIAIMGYDNLCIALYEDEALARAVFDKVGSGLLKYYEYASEYDTVGVVMSNDDWGFKTQTFLSVTHMRKYVFPWHKKIVETAHKRNKPALLHSCGYAGDIMEDIIEDMGYDGKHSYEDIIMPVESVYEKWGDRIAVLGGIDVDFLIKSEPGVIADRCRKILDITQSKGYALGSGNSIPEYIPYEKYRAMIDCV